MKLIKLKSHVTVQNAILLKKIGYCVGSDSFYVVDKTAFHKDKTNINRQHYHHISETYHNSTLEETLNSKWFERPRCSEVSAWLYYKFGYQYQYNFKYHPLKKNVDGFKVNEVNLIIYQYNAVIEKKTVVSNSIERSENACFEIILNRIKNTQNDFK